MSWETEVLADSPTIWSRFQGFTATPGTTHGTPTWQENGLLGAAEAVRLPFGQHAIQYVAPTEVVSGSSPWSIELIARNTYATGIYERVLAFQPQNRTTWGYISVKNGTVAANFGGVTCFGPDGNGDADQWRHIVLVADGATLSLYVNGALLDSQVLTSWAFPAGSDSGPSYDSIYLAGAHDAGTSGDLPNDTAVYTDQYIDEFAYYPSALLAGRVAAHYAEAAGAAGETIDLSAQISLDTNPRFELTAQIEMAVTETIDLSAQIALRTDLVNLSAKIQLATREAIPPLTAQISLQGLDQTRADAVSGYWTAKAYLGGVDVSEQLTGDCLVEYEEDASGLGTVVLYPNPGSFLLTDYVGERIVVEYQDLDGSGVVQGTKTVYSGYVSDPYFDPDEGRLTLECTTDLQGALDSATREEIDAMTPGAAWSPWVFEEGAQGFEYASDRMRSTPASMWHSPGGIVVTDWAAKVVPDIEFTDEDVIDGSISYENASRRDLLNDLQITFDYRYERMRQRTIGCLFTMTQTFCDLLINGFKICQRSMVESAAAGGGWVVQGDIQYEDLPEAGTYRCFPFAFGAAGAKYIGWGRLYLGYLLDDPDWEKLCWGASWKAAKRWTQSVTERHAITIQAPQSQVNNGAITSRESYSMKSTQSTSEWVNDPDFEGTGGKTGFAVVDGYPSGDAVLGDVARDATDDPLTGRDAADAARGVAIKVGVTDLLSAHRQSRVVFSSTFQPHVDLTKTVRLNSVNMQATGKVRRVRHVFGIESGQSETEIELAISRHFGSGLVSSSPLDPEVAPDKPVETDIPKNKYLGSHVGGTSDTAALVDGWDGYFTNYTFDFTATDPFAAEPGSPTAVFYPEQFICEYPEISGGALNALDIPADQTIDVDIPEDELTLIQ